MGFQGNLFPYQEEGGRFLEKMKRAILADQTGVGKTRTAVATAVKVTSGGEQWMVCAPKFICSEWASVCEGVFGLKVCRAYGDTAAQRRKNLDQDLDDCDALIINYEGIKRLDPRILAIDWKVVVGDEAHFLQNRNSGRTKAFKVLVNMKGREVEYVWPLTATPVWDNLDTMWAVLNILYPKDFTSYWRFAEKYCRIVRTPFGVEVKGTRPEMVEEAKRLLSKYMLRRLKRDVIKDLPPVTTEVVMIEPHPVVAKENREIWKSMKEEGELSLARAKVHLLDRSQFEFKEDEVPLKISGKYVPPKKPYLEKILDEEYGNKILIIVKHTKSGEIVSGWLKSRKEWMSQVPISGQIPVEKREEIVDEFRSVGGCAILIGTCKTIGTGLNLQEASVIIFVEHPDLYAEYEQAIGRISRIGTSKEQTIYHLVQKGTLDHRVYNACVKRASAYEELGL